MTVDEMLSLARYCLSDPLSRSEERLARAVIELLSNEAPEGSVQADVEDHEPELEAQYPCHSCGKLRTKAQGGTVFTECDDCWADGVTEGK